MIQLETLLSYCNTSMTDLQMDRFVTIKAGGTTYGCFFQALRELMKRTRALHADYIERRKLEIKLAKLEQRGTDMAAVKADELRFAIVLLERQTKTDEGQFLRFYSQASSLFRHLGFDRKPPTAEELERLELERWEHHCLCSLAVDFICCQSPMRSFMELIQSLPDGSRGRVLQRAFGPDITDKGRDRYLKALAKWYLNYTPDLPEPLALSEAESRELLLQCESSNLPRLLQLSSPMAAISSPESSYPSDLGFVKPALCGQVSDAVSAVA